MARTAIPVCDRSTNAGTAHAGTALDPTNGMYIPASAQAKGGRFEVVIHHTGGTAGTVSVLPGDNPPSSLAAGTLTMTIAGSTYGYIFSLETAKYSQDDQTINIDLSASFAGTVRVYTLPRDF